jgi:hypothetical protein
MIDKLHEWDKEKADLLVHRRRLEEENVWLVEQLHLSRKVGQDIEALTAARQELSGKGKDGQFKTDLGQRLHEMHLEKTKLEQENQKLQSKIARLSKEMEKSLLIGEDWKNQGIFINIMLIS